jgi:hypothetical protein
MVFHQPAGTVLALQQHDPTQMRKPGSGARGIAQPSLPRRLSRISPSEWVRTASGVSPDSRLRPRPEPTC